MIVISDEHRIGVMSADNCPAAFCGDGDKVLFETRDCSDGAVSRDGNRDRTPGKYIPNPATGPLYVRSAMPGDILKVEILKIECAPWGFMGTGFGNNYMKNIRGEYRIRTFDTADGKVKLGGHTFSVSPMVGVIGVAPEGMGIDTETPASHGGNMDCTMVREGSAVYFPVNTPGALLAMGDLHAAMGDGEVCWYGLETAGKVTVRVSVVHGIKLKMPAVIDRQRFAVIASAPTLDECTRLAIEQMYDLLTGFGWDRTEAGYLMSLKCCLTICQCVDPNMTVRAEIPAELLRPAEGNESFQVSPF